MDYQIEATCRLGDWDKLSILLENNLQDNKKEQNFILIDDDDSKKNTALNETFIFQGNYSWGSQTASLISALKLKNEKLFNIRIDNVRSALMESILAMTMENLTAHYYSQVYEYIVRYIFFEINNYN